MSSQWYYTKNGEKCGPITDLQLKQLAESGEIKPTDMLWKEGMAEWKSANLFKALFNSAPMAPQPPEQFSAKKLWQNVGKVANQISAASSDVLSGDDSNGSQPAIILHSNYFGGRTRIGLDLKPLSTFSGTIVAAIVSWLYILSVIKSTISAWHFLPFGRTEYIKIKLEQSVKWNKIFPVFVTWLVFIIISIVAALIFIPILNIFAILVFLFGYVVSNIIACQMISGFDINKMHMSVIKLEYGFPHKYSLLHGISDAPTNQQLDCVLSLCEAISKSDFSKWEQFTAHSSGQSGMISRVVSRLPGLGG